MTETWRAIPGYEGHYEASDQGRIRSVKRPDSLVLRGSPHVHGYRNVHLTVLGRRRTFTVHQLVMLTFVGPRPDGMTDIRHLDGDPGNNRLSNLVYGTRAENIRDAQEHGRMRPRDPERCVHGHPWTDFYQRPNGHRVCRICKNEVARLRYASARAS